MRGLEAENEFDEKEEKEKQLNSPPGTGGVAEGRGGSKVEMVLGKLFDLSTTPSLRDSPPVPGGELSCSSFFLQIHPRLL